MLKNIKRVIDGGKREGVKPSKCNYSNIQSDSTCRNWSQSEPGEAAPYIKSYCSQRLDGSQYCESFKYSAPSLYKEMAKSFCDTTTNVGTDTCIDWCRANPGECDASMDVYCRDNPTAEICSCLNSPAGDLTPNPKCYDTTCTTKGYLTKPMADFVCPSVVDCSIALDIAARGNVNMVGVDFQQQCGGVGSGVGSGDSGNSGEDTAETAGVLGIIVWKIKEGYFDELTTQEIIVIVFIVIVALFVIIGGVKFLTGGSDDYIEDEIYDPFVPPVQNAYGEYNNYGNYGVLPPDNIAGYMVPPPPPLDAFNTYDVE